MSVMEILLLISNAVLVAWILRINCQTGILINAVSQLQSCEFERSTRELAAINALLERAELKEEETRQKP